MNTIKYTNHHVSIINLTPHAVVLHGAGSPGGTDTFEVSPNGPARCVETIEQLPTLSYDPFHDGGMAFGASIQRKTFGAVTGLPDYDPTKPWLMYIVSQMVADACPDRDDLLVTSDVVRDDAGRVVGCRAFSWRPAR